ncbi:MAG TPA: LLM class F420-dependent oxidoreductase [Actinomycetota bacterium]|nr:LLM class F420-dependent oxidoreductase [Actinomycetota bacterium]
MVLAVRVALMIEGQEGVTWEEWVALAEACEEHGFDALFRSDHYLSFGHPTEWGTLDAWTTLAGLAPKTERIRLGTLVSPITFRHPSALAKSVVTVDHISGGRVELGMGGGWFEREHRAYGFDFPSNRERIDRLAEQVEIVHRLWDRDEDEVTFDGAHYHLEAVPALPKPLQEPHPPLIIGGMGGPRTLALAARWADEYNTHNQPPEQLRELRSRLEEACERVDRDPSSLPLSLMTGTLIGSDQADLEARAARLMARTGQGDGDPSAFLAGRRPGEITGTVELALQQLAAFAEAGVTRVMMQHLDHQDLDFVALVGHDVVPEAAAL